MNWQQLYTTATPAERAEITQLLLRRIALRQRATPSLDLKQKMDRAILNFVIYFYPAHWVTSSPKLRQSFGGGQGGGLLRAP